MLNYHHPYLLVFTFGVALLFSGCSTKTKVESDLGIKGAPEWVNEGTQFLNDQDGRLFHGVGQAPVMKDASLQISTADNRARAEVARILSSYMDVISNDFTAAAGTGKDTVSQQSVSRQIRNLSKVNLSGVKIIGHWKNEKDGTIFAIAELDFNQIKKTTDMVKDMNGDLKRYINTHGENIFDSLSKEK